MPDEEVVTPDPLKNVKAEMDRKFGNFETQVAALADTNTKLAAQLERMAALVPDANVQKPAASNKTWSQKFYENEDATLQEIRETATRDAVEIMSRQSNIENRKNAAIAQMANEYPELTDTASDLRKKSVEIFNALPKEEQASAGSLKLAVREAAAELALLPLNKRPKKDETMEDDDTFSLDGSGGGNTPRGSRGKKGKDAKLSDATMEFAQLLGRPVDDEKYLERLKKTNQRTVWNKYRKV